SYAWYGTRLRYSVLPGTKTFSPTRRPLMRNSYKPSAVTYSRVAAIGLSTANSLRSIGAGGLVYGPPKMSEAIHFADQSRRLSNPISHVAGSLQGETFPSASHVRTFHTQRSRELSFGPAYSTWID